MKISQLYPCACDMIKSKLHYALVYYVLNIVFVNLLNMYRNYDFFTLLHSEWPKLYGVLAILSAKVLQ